MIHVGPLMASVSYLGQMFWTEVGRREPGRPSSGDCPGPPVLSTSLPRAAQARGDVSGTQQSAGALLVGGRTMELNNGDTPHLASAGIRAQR